MMTVLMAQMNEARKHFWVSIRKVFGAGAKLIGRVTRRCETATVRARVS